MNTIKIEKFIINHRYSSKSTNKLILFELAERDGKELTFTVFHSDRKTTATGEVKVEAYKNGAREVVRVGCIEGYFDVAATDVLPVGRKLSELPLEEREKIKNVIKQDFERRKRLNLNHTNVTTLYKTDKDGKAHYTGNVEE